MWGCGGVGVWGCVGVWVCVCVYVWVCVCVCVGVGVCVCVGGQLILSLMPRCPGWAPVLPARAAALLLLPPAWAGGSREGFERAWAARAAALPAVPPA